MGQPNALLFAAELLAEGIKGLIVANLILAGLALLGSLWAVMNQKRGVPFAWGRLGLFAYSLHGICIFWGALAIFAFTRDPQYPFGLWDCLTVSALTIGPGVVGILCWSIIRQVARRPEWPSLNPD